MDNRAFSPEGDLSTGREKKVLRRNVDVAIIGNGPSGIFLSLLLSGYRPYYKGGHPDPFLSYKLNEHPEQSIIDQDLQYLSEGLEGRSQNQLSLLMDTLLHPHADIGEHLPSTLHWEHHKSKYISHVVIGSNKPGGSWHDMKKDVQSLSLGSWLELPIYSFQSWVADKEGPGATDMSSKRVSLGTVAQYYSDYVSKLRLEENMMEGIHVSKVKERPSSVICSVGSPTCSSPHSTSSVSSEPGIPQTSPPHWSSLPFHAVDSGLTLSERGGCSDASKLSDMSRDSSPCFSDPEDDGVYCSSSKKKCYEYKWQLKGSDGHRDVVVSAKNLVLACGVGENPRHLGINGEETPLVCHQFSDFCQRLDTIDRNHHPVVVVGAGLCAADAIILCMSKNLKVVHIFRQDPNDPALIFNKMHHTLYPEYRHVLSLMKGEKQDKLYAPASRSKLLEFTNENTCLFENSEQQRGSLSVSMVGVFIGSEAPLPFIPTRVRAELAVEPSLPIHAKTNPVDVDPLTFESESCPSLYALGPLAGDHFVRFVLGSGLGVCRHLVEKLL